MINEQSKELYLEAIKTCGIDSQVNMFIEEMGEVLQALMKLKRADPGSKEASLVLENLQEEIADVQITAEQAQIIFGEDRVNKFKRKKLTRLDSRLAKHRQK